MTSRRQRLQGSRLFTHEEDYSSNTPNVENDAPSLSSGVLAQTSRYHRHHDPFLTHSQRFPLYSGEASSSQTSIPPHNQHDQSLAVITTNQSCTSNSTSLLFAEDPVPSELASFNHDIRSFLNDHQSTGQASHQRKRKSSSNVYFPYF